jgi:hypothetical protein
VEDAVDPHVPWSAWRSADGDTSGGLHDGSIVIEIGYRRPAKVLGADPTMRECGAPGAARLTSNAGPVVYTVRRGPPMSKE